MFGKPVLALGLLKPAFALPGRSGSYSSTQISVDLDFRPRMQHTLGRDGEALVGHSGILGAFAGPWVEACRWVTGLAVLDAGLGQDPIHRVGPFTFQSGFWKLLGKPSLLSGVWGIAHILRAMEAATSPLGAS
jgi:hypothetical protein